MRKKVYTSLKYLACLSLAVSCSKDKIKREVSEVKINIQEKDSPACLNKLISALGYTQDKYTRLITECNILKIQSLDSSIRKFKGQRRLEIVYLNVKCDEISRMLSQYEATCKNNLTVTEL